MAKKAITNAGTEELLAELKKRQRQLPKLEAKREKLLAQLEEVEAQIEELGGIGTGKRPGTGRRPRNAMSLSDAIASVLTPSKPKSIADIIEAVKATGYKSSAANFRAVVSQALIKDKRFKAKSRGQYVLAK